VKVALLGDVHANLPALEAVLAHAGKYPIEAVWNTGDFVGYGAFPDEVVQRLKEKKAVGIIGNYDLKVLQVKEEKAAWKKSKVPEKWQAFKWAHEHLSKDSRDYLRSLPQELRFKAAGKKFLLIHGSPLSIKERLTSDTPDKRLRELSQAAKADVIICGHSHRPFVRELDGVYFVNPGSVGRPDDGDPRASYAILSITSKSIQVQHYRIKYDVEQAVSAIRSQHLPEVFAHMLLQGRNLEGVAEDGIPVPQPLPKAKAHDRDGCIQSALKLAESQNYAAGHARQVTRLAVDLFDQLKSLHGLGKKERLWLECAGLLHDIGLASGVKQHHKSSLQLILESPLPPFDDREKLMIGGIARYHRKALPSQGHEHFASLAPSDQEKVGILAAILRVADALDRTHQNIVRAVSVEISAEQIVIKAAVRGPAEEETEAALRKGDLLNQVFKRNLIIKCRRI